VEKLWWSRLLGRHSGAHVDAVLANRRRFVKTGSAPAMFTLNGVGTRVYGKDEPSADGTWIGTQFLTFIYLPVVPLDQYVMNHAGGRTYRFYGKVPFGPTAYAWRGLVAALVVAGAGAGAWAAVQASLPDVEQARVRAQAGEGPETDDPLSVQQAAAWLGPDALHAALSTQGPAEDLDQRPGCWATARRSALTRPRWFRRSAAQPPSPGPIAPRSRSGCTTAPGARCPTTST